MVYLQSRYNKNGAPYFFKKQGSLFPIHRVNMREFVCLFLLNGCEVFVLGSNSIFKQHQSDVNGVTNLEMIIS